MSFNPFEPFLVALVAAFRKEGERWVVTQTCHAAFDHYGDLSVINLLLTQYADQGLAQSHLKALTGDSYRYLLDLENPLHMDKLSEMLQPESKYRLFTSVIKSADKLKERIDKKYKGSMARYIAANTRWKIGAGEQIKPAVKLIFGEVYVLLKYGKENIRVRLSDLEKY